jgi:Holliday junction resolvase RusA-like endonuclease
MIELNLPAPPSANAMYTSRYKRAGRRRTPEYIQWQCLAGWHIQKARQKPIEGPVSISLVVGDNRRRDIDNYFKPICDILVAHQLIQDDRNKYVREIKASWSPSVEGCRVTVTACVSDNPSGAGAHGHP